MGRWVAERPRRTGPSTDPSPSTRSGSGLPLLGATTRPGRERGAGGGGGGGGAAAGGEHEVERLGRGDEEVRRPAEQRLSLRGGGVAGTDADADGGLGVAELRGHGGQRRPG